MTKVVSFKTSDEIYNKLKQTNKSFRSVIEPLVIDFFNKERRYTHNIPKETPDDYETTSKQIDELLEAKK